MGAVCRTPGTAMVKSESNIVESKRPHAPIERFLPFYDQRIPKQQPSPIAMISQEEESFPYATCLPPVSEIDRVSKATVQYTLRGLTREVLQKKAGIRKRKRLTASTFLNLPAGQVVQVARICNTVNYKNRIKITTDDYHHLASVVGVPDTHWFELEDAQGRQFILEPPFVFNILQQVSREYINPHPSHVMGVERYCAGHGAGCGVIAMIRASPRERPSERNRRSDRHVSMAILVKQGTERIAGIGQQEEQSAMSRRSSHESGP